ncbi:plasmid maintenance system killer protein [Terriglobus roseus DSM 18391]|uniref:Plasmid maintenance system killer protein n=2 Tax=Terriglobus roseus TaxID=392734 RepID=I3ZKN0_TERRK|nr:plasmid maintenance system killer protein [Terriglobus roseus DSM 18391]
MTWARLAINCAAAEQVNLSLTRVALHATVEGVIGSFRHAGLEKFFKSGSKAGIQPAHASRLELQLGVLNAAEGPEDMAVPGWKLHALQGKLRGHYAVSVNGNWRMVFAFDGTDAILVDYSDYH